MESVQPAPRTFAKIRNDARRSGPRDRWGFKIKSLLVQSRQYLDQFEGVMEFCVPVGPVSRLLSHRFREVSVFRRNTALAGFRQEAVDVHREQTPLGVLKGLMTRGRSQCCRPTDCHRNDVVTRVPLLFEMTEVQLLDDPFQNAVERCPRQVTSRTPKVRPKSIFRSFDMHCYSLAHCFLPYSGWWRRQPAIAGDAPRMWLENRIAGAHPPTTSKNASAAWLSFRRAGYTKRILRSTSISSTFTSQSRPWLSSCSTHMRGRNATPSLRSTILRIASTG